MSKKNKPYKFPSKVYVTHEIDPNDDEDGGYLVANTDADSAAHDDAVAVYIIDGVLRKQIDHTLVSTV